MLPTLDEIRLDDHVPLDPAVLQGAFSTGMNYYIRANLEPPGRAELIVAIKVGSVHEKEDERGIAHMLEHLTFRGSKDDGGKVY